MHLSKYGPQMVVNGGWIGQIGAYNFRHTFGGAAWNVVDDTGIDKQPTLLITLDLADNRLTSLRASGLSELPLCSHINSDAWVCKQVFQIDSKNRFLRLVEREQQHPATVPADLAFPNPLPEKPIRLRDMSPHEVPSNETSYWQSCDSFLGGNSFLRVLGPPVWLDEPMIEHCACGAQSMYCMSIGYEQFDSPGGYLPERPFFIGECALYFFWCRTCLRVTVRSQSS